MALKYYIVCVPEIHASNQRAMPYSVQAEGPLGAARKVFFEHPNLKDRCNGEITVVEAKAGRLDTSWNYYTLDVIFRNGLGFDSD
jgi:hypothetical protein